MIMIVTLIISLSVIECELDGSANQNPSPPFSISALNSSQAIYFDKLWDMRIVADEWKLIVYYNVTSYWQGIMSLKRYYQRLVVVCDKIKSQMHCDAVLQQLRQDYEELVFYNDIMTKQHNSLRKEQARFANIGNIKDIATGFLDGISDHYVNKYQKKIHEAMDQMQIGRLWENHTSVIEAEYNMLKKNSNEMKQQHKLINDNLNKLEQAIKFESQGIFNGNNFIVSTLITNNLVNKLKKIQQWLMDTMTDMYNGKINIRLLNINQIQEQFDLISQRIPEELTLPTDDVNTNLKDLFKALKVNMIPTQNLFIFEVLIPLLSRTNYEVFELIPIPRLVEPMKSVTIAPTTKYVTIDQHKTSYIPMDKEEIQQCVHMTKIPNMCAIKNTRFKFTSSADFCLQDHNTNQCLTEMKTCQNIWRELHSNTNYLFYFCDPMKVEITCNKTCGPSSSSITLTDAGIIDLADTCNIKSSFFFTHLRNRLTSDMLTETDVQTQEIPELVEDRVNRSILLNANINLTDGDPEVMLDNIRQQLNEIKNVTRTVSDNDVHQFSIIYIIVACAGAMLCRYLFSKVCAVSSPTSTVDQQSATHSDVDVQSVNTSVDLPSQPDMDQHEENGLDENIASK